MFEYTMTCTDPSITEVSYIYIEDYKEITQIEYNESI
jgi:hypothetical protein